MDAEKSTRVPFYIFRHYVTVSNYLFSSDIRYPQYLSTNNFSIIIQSFHVISEVNYDPLKRRKFKNIALYPNFWCISELYCILLRRWRRFENKRSHLSQHSISEFLKRCRAQKAPSECLDTYVSLFIRKSHILKRLFEP